MARFISADSVVPGNASGGMDGVALKGLTVDFHEPGFAAGIGSENSQPFWFQMSDEQRQQAGDPWGPQNPQALNRYSYVQNRPMRYNDPSGHSIYPNEPENWRTWRAKAHEVVDRFYRKLEGQLSDFMNKLSAAIDSGVNITEDWINNEFKELNIDPVLQHLIKTTLDILGGGVLSTALKAPFLYVKIYPALSVRVAASTLAANQSPGEAYSFHSARPTGSDCALRAMLLGTTDH